MSDETPQLKNFLEKYRVAKSANSKEIRLTMQDAENLAAAIGVALAKQVELADMVIDLQKQIISAEVQQDGGKF
jgi:hypothetical protein